MIASLVSQVVEVSEEFSPAVCHAGPWPLAHVQ